MDEKLELSDDRPIWVLDSIEQDLQKVYDHFRAIKAENDYLRQENQRLKDEAYKDKELAKMKEQYERMKSDYYRGFPISEEEYKNIHTWMEKLPESDTKMGTVGGRFTYVFHPTSIGVVGEIVDTITKDKFVFQDLD